MEIKQTLAPEISRSEAERAETVAAAFSALGSPVRLAVLRALVRAGGRGMAVGALQRRLGLAASTLSHHLSALERAGLIARNREGRTLLCRAQFAAVEGLATYLLSECCAEETGHD